MKPFWDAVKTTKTSAIGDDTDMDQEVARIADLIESRVGRVTGNEALRKVIREVLPYHLYCQFSGMRGEAPLNTVEYAALALGEDIRVAAKGDNRGRVNPKKTNTTRD